MSKAKILITRKWPASVEAELMKHYDVQCNDSDVAMTVDELRAALGEYDAILPTVTDNMGAAVFDTDTIRTKAICNYGVGFSHIDIPAAQAAGITVTNTPDVLSECTADIAMTLMLMVARRAGEGEREVRAGAWSGWRPTHLIGKKASNKKVGIVGFGRIGQEFARRAHFGFNCEIFVQNRSQVAQDKLDQFNATQVPDLETLFQTCDVISLHCPGGDANRHLINADIMAHSKPGLILINTARGEVVDEVALAQALHDGTIGGAGLDVFDGEPNIMPDTLNAPNIVMLPHLGSATDETRVEMGMRAMENLNAIMSGKAPRDPVT